MSRVTEYKVCKAIAQGAPVHEATLVKITQRPASEVLAVLIKLYPDQFGTPSVDVPPRTEATLRNGLAHLVFCYPAHEGSPILRTSTRVVSILSTAAQATL